MYMIWSTKNKPFRDCSLWYRGCYAIGWAIEGCPGKGILDNPHVSISYTIYNISICVPSLLWRKTWRPKPEMDNNPRYTLAIIPCCAFLHLLRVRQLWPARWDGRGIWGIRRIRRVWIEKKGRRRSLSRTQMETAHLASGSERSGPKSERPKRCKANDWGSMSR